MFFPFIQHQTIISCTHRFTENILIYKKKILNFIEVYIALFCIIGIFLLMPSPTAGERDIQKHRLISLILITDQMHPEIDSNNSNEKRITTNRTMASPMEKRNKVLISWILLASRCNKKKIINKNKRNFSKEFLDI